HLNALARHVGVELSIDDWQTYGEEIPLLVNLQPAGEYLGEDYYHAGGVPAVMGELIKQDLIDTSAITVNGRTVGENYTESRIQDEKVIRPFERPLKERAGFRVLKGNLFTSAIMKTSVISPEFREHYLSDPTDPEAFTGRAVVFDGPEDYHARIDDPALKIDLHTILFMRGAGPIGYPGAAEVVNMRAPDYLLKQGINSLPCIGDGRQSGTSGSPSILNASPEAAAGGGLALLRTGDMVRIDLKEGSANILITNEELTKRQQELSASGGYVYPDSQTPWQEIQRAYVGQLETGAVLEPAVKYQRIAQTKGIPRDNH
ncbi:MAG: dihydroxy-acid dehydratase, partial [Rhizobiaceae bacterium]|nr:dihydroxy-acid dehydratase [Rhizobiaceae bacterium]